MTLPKFVVHCDRIRKTKKYLVRFPINSQLAERIKKLPYETRKWSALLLGWEITAPSLFILMKNYKGSDKIFFNFGSDDSRKAFIGQINKFKIEEKEKRAFIAELNIKKEQWVKYKAELENTYEQYSEKLHAFLKEGVKLYPHQIVSAMFMNVTRNTLISHEMGLGKTLSSILYVEMNDYDKVFVITPNSLKFNYYDEVKKFTNSNAYIIKWSKNNCQIEDAKYVIVNYEYFNPSDKKKFVKKWTELNLGKINAVICDESHRLKNTKSNTFKNYKRTFNKKIFKDEKVSKIYLSGTPAPNRAKELYSILNQISPLDFPTKNHFYEYYCGMTYNRDDGWGYEVNQTDTKFEELYHKIAPFTHRKRKAEALNLPDKIYQKIIMELSDREYTTYCEIEEGIANEFVVNPEINPLVTMLRLRQYTSQLKVKPAIELIENVLATGEKVVIVDTFKEPLYELKEKLGDISALHTGDQSVEERAEIIKKFQDPNSNLKVFIGSIQTCNYGLTLTAASKLFIMTLPYSVGEYDQVSDRLHRIGQKNLVNIYPLMFTDTIDDYVFSAIENKRKEILKVIDNEDYESNINESVFTEVINKIKEKYGKRIFLGGKPV